MSDAPAGPHASADNDGDVMSGAPAGCDTFGRPGPGLRTTRRRELRIHLARARHRRSGGDERPAIDAATTAPDPAVLAEAKRRFAICQACEHSRDKAFACELFKGCCFGRFRSNPANHCPAGRW